MDTLATTPASTPAPTAQTAVKTETAAIPAAQSAPVAGVKAEAVPAGDNTSVTSVEAVVEPKYELKAPEGYEGDLKAVVELAKANKISEEAAQKLLEHEHSVRVAAVKARDDKQLQAWEQRVTGWAETAKADPEIGGHNLSVTQENARRVLSKYDAAGAFAKELEATGFGNHPTVLRFLSAIGKSMSEDRFILGTQAAPSVDARAVFAKSNMKP